MTPSKPLILLKNSGAFCFSARLTDGGGLFIEVSAAGLKTWRYQYRFGGVRREVTIGKFPEVGVADARDRHFELRSLLERGLDPLDSRRQKLSEQKERASEGKSVVPRC